MYSLDISLEVVGNFKLNSSAQKLYRIRFSLLITSLKSNHLQ